MINDQNDNTTTTSMNEHKSIHAWIKQLRKQLTEWEIAYYRGQPLVDDEAYDAHYQELVNLEQNHPQYFDPYSPTNRVGKNLVKHFEKVDHVHPMLSLNNAFNDFELARFYDHAQSISGLRPISFILEPKIDGSSISLIYRNNQLVQAITRGDGQVGENIISNVKTIRNIPLVVVNGPGDFEVRGEIFMNKSDFLLHNQSLAAAGQKTLMNPRNAVAGALRLQNPAEVAKKPLKAIFYQLINAEQFKIFTQKEVHEKLRSWGIPTFALNQLILVDNWEALKTVITDFGQQKEQLSFLCDGLVIKVNQLSEYPLIGYTTKFPKWAIAYKYPTTIKQTMMLDIYATTGRTGMITYVAKLAPVVISGTTVTSATLHNAEYIMAKDIRIGDVVSVYKAGEIIPKVIGPDLSQRKPDVQVWQPHTTCSACNTTLIQKNDQVDQYCPNQNCIEQVCAKIIHFCHRKAMNIEGISTQIVKKLFHQKLLTKIVDLYTLKDHKTTILSSDLKIKNKLFTKLTQAIETSKKLSLEKLLHGLGISHVGEKVALVLAQKFQNLTTIAQLSLNDLTMIPEIGPIIGQSIVEWFSQPENQLTISQIQAHGVNFHYLNPQQIITTSPLSNKAVVITGVFSIDRNQLINILVQKFGCKILSSVSPKTNFLLCGEHPGSKLAKAQHHNIPIINNEQLMKLIDETD